MLLFSLNYIILAKVTFVEGEALGFTLGCEIPAFDSATVLPVVLEFPFGSCVITRIEGETVVVDFHNCITFSYTIFKDRASNGKAGVQSLQARKK